MKEGENPNNSKENARVNVLFRLWAFSTLKKGPRAKCEKETATDNSPITVKEKTTLWIDMALILLGQKTLDTIILNLMTGRWHQNLCKSEDWPSHSNITRAQERGK